MIEDYIEALDIAYVSSFSTKVETNWGYLFYNENQPNYYDANHAYLSSYNGNVEEIINEVIVFYQQKNITPRFYLSNYDGHQGFVKALKRNGFDFEEFESPVQLLKQKIEIVRQPLVTIEAVTSENMQAAIDIECQIQELGGAIREQAFKEFLYKQDARLESVATIERYRGKGLIGQLIHHIQEDIEKKHIERFWVLPISERVEKVYKKSGFETILTLKIGHAFLGGKSITDIRNGF